MSYAIAAALQQAVFSAISNDATVQSLIGSAVYDAMPTGTPPQTYVVIGEEDARTHDDISAQGTVHMLLISVISQAAGFADAKAVAVALSDVLVDAAPVLTRGRVVNLGFDSARVRRDVTQNIRRIDMKFRAQVEDI